MISTILVASDGSAVSKLAEQHAIGLAERLQARLLGISVIEDRLARGLEEDGLGLAPPSQEAFAAYLKGRAAAVCKRIAEQARRASVSESSESAQGIADDLIVARGQQADLLVLGRDGQHRAHRTGLIGSTVDGVVRKTGQSVLVVPDGAERVGPIVLAFDGSPGSHRAAALAVELASRLGEALWIFVDSKDKGRALARFDEVRGLLGNPAVPVREVSSTLGRPDVKVVDTAREAHAGMIVMGAYGRNRITEYFLGSNASAVIRTSPVAVLVAR